MSSYLVLYRRIHVDIVDDHEAVLNEALDFFVGLGGEGGFDITEGGITWVRVENVSLAYIVP